MMTPRIALLAALLTSLPITAAFAQSRGSFSNNRLNRIVGQATRVDSINQVINRDLRIGTATNDVRRTAANSGVNAAKLGIAPVRSRAASFGSVGSRSAAKPFQNVSQRPTVSPYLGLFNENIDVNAVNYNTFVRPLQQQQNLRQQVQRQDQQTQRSAQQRSRDAAALNLRLQQIAAQSAFNPTGSQTTPPTGHTTAFGSTLRYFGGR